MSNREKLRELLIDVLLLDPDEFSFELARSDVPTWDSLAVVSVAVGVQEDFGHHFSPEVAAGIQSVQDIVTILESMGVAFDE